MPQAESEKSAICDFFFWCTPSGFDIVMLNLPPGICTVGLFLSNTVTQQQIFHKSLPTCFSFPFCFTQLERLQILKAEAVAGRLASESVRCKQRVSSSNETARTEHMLSCFVGGLSVTSLPPSFHPSHSPSLPTSVLPPRSRSDCMSLPRSLTVRERMLPNAQPLSVRASEPPVLVPDTRPRERYV